ncbi:MAG TPA: choice-of-anchor tandem repeat GloVer-containing protein [Candidatus Cybelea sp.]
MNALSFGRLALCIGAGALFAACGALRQGQNEIPSVSKAGAAPQARTTPTPLTYVYGLRAIYSFNGDPDGQEPNSNIVARSSNPVVIGTTESGGYYDAGSVYGISKSKKGGWTESILYSLTGSDGWRPNGIMVPQLLDGTEPAAVTSFQGGAHGAGAIAILKPNASGAWTLLSTYSFSGQADGGGPQGAVVADAYGNLYGTTGGGGHKNNGVVYQLHPSGSTYKEKVLYSFHGRRDGVVPEAGLIMDSTGALYGTTLYGGKSNAYKGTVFKLTPNTHGYTESIIYSFKGPPDGSEPVARLCLDSSGTFYGTTSLGGKNNAGTVFSLVPSGSGYAEHVLWSFGSGSADGAYPDGNVIVDSNGVIYGTTLGNSGSGSGTLFTLKRHRERLYYFNGYDGGDPVAGPAADPKGNVFVAASSLGAHLDGTVDIAHVHTAALTCE